MKMLYSIGIIVVKRAHLKAAERGRDPTEKKRYSNKTAQEMLKIVKSIALLFGSYGFP